MGKGWVLAAACFSASKGPAEGAGAVLKGGSGNASVRQATAGHRPTYQRANRACAHHDCEPGRRKMPHNVAGAQQRR